MTGTIHKMVQQMQESGVEPLQLDFEVGQYFDSKQAILRSSLLINSLDLGVLRHSEYRYVARRRKKGDELTARHLRKLLAIIPRLLTDAPYAECVTFPTYPQSLLSGSLRTMLFEQLNSHPAVSPDQLCVELSADLLYEDTVKVKARMEELRGLGIKIAIFELGDEYCPVFKLNGLPFDYAFADGYSAALLREDDNEAASILPKTVHLFGAHIFAPPLQNEQEFVRARQVEYDGYCIDMMCWRDEQKQDLSTQIQEAEYEKT